MKNIFAARFEKSLMQRNKNEHAEEVEYAQMETRAIHGSFRRLALLIKEKGELRIGRIRADRTYMYFINRNSEWVSIC